MCCHVLCCLQPEEFYNFCDENGLLIWQDAMFGGSHYPRTAQWLENYAEEIKQQVWSKAMQNLRYCVDAVRHFVVQYATIGCSSHPTICLMSATAILGE